MKALYKCSSFALILAIAWVLLLLGGCAPRYLEKTPAAALYYPYLPVSPQELSEFQTNLRAPASSLQAAKAEYWIAQEAFNRAEWKQAETLFLKIPEKYPDSDWAPLADLMAARARIKLKVPLAALTLIYPLIEPQPASALLFEHAQTLAEKIINDELDLTQLEQVRTTYAGSAWEQQAWFVSGKRNLDYGKPSAAIKIFDGFLARFPQSKFAPGARELKAKASQIVPIDRNRIGGLLALSGTYAPYGKNIQQGLELALEQINQGRAEEEKLSLVYADTKGTTSGAVLGLRRLAEEEKVMAVIGPTLSSSVRAIIPECNRLSLPVITTSAAEPGLLGTSPYLFRYMLTNEAQAIAMAEYIILRKNLQRVAILNSEQPYDRSLAQALAKRVQELGGEIIIQLGYPSGTTDFKTQMMALGGVDPGYLKDVELQERKRMEQMLENMAFNFAQEIAPAPDPSARPTPIPLPPKNVAIVRFLEEGDQTQKQQLGKVFTENFSYALASQARVHVLTQEQTFKGLRQVGLSPLTLNRQSWRNVGEALGVEFLVLGRVTQKAEETMAVPGEPVSVRYQIELNLVDCLKAKALKNLTHGWSKTLPVERNLKDLEALYLPVSAHDAVLIVSQLAFYDLKPRLFGVDAWLLSQGLRQGGDILEGAILTTGFWLDNPSPPCREFVAAFEKRFSASPTLLAVQAYDALSLVAGVLKQLSPPYIQRGDFKNQLLKVRDFQGITGQATVDPDGEIRRAPIFLEWTQEQLRQVH